MVLNVLQVGEAVLRRRAKPVAIDEIQSPPIQQLIEHMRDTMREAPGVGLAAPQIGIPLQLAVIEDRAELLQDIKAEWLAETERRPGPFQVTLNPTVTLGEGTGEFLEGCLGVAVFGVWGARARGVTGGSEKERPEPVCIEASGWY